MTLLFAVLAIALGCALIFSVLSGAASRSRSRNRIDESFYTGREDQEWIDHSGQRGD